MNATELHQRTGAFRIDGLVDGLIGTGQNRSQMHHGVDASKTGIHIFPVRDVTYIPVQ
jgi:hypothetical protein